MRGGVLSVFKLITTGQSTCFVNEMNEMNEWMRHVMWYYYFVWKNVHAKCM